MRVGRIIMQGRCRTNRTCALRWAVVGLILLHGVGAAPGAQPEARKPLPEATVLDGVDGTVVPPDANDGWLFELAADVNTAQARVAGGTRLPLLPSAALERLIADANDRQAPKYRLSAYVTQYQRRNYLFPTYYLPLSKLRGTPSSQPQPEQTSQAVGPIPESEPNLTIPKEIIEKLRSRRPIRGAQRIPPSEGQETQDAKVRSPSPVDRVLVDSIGMIEQKNGRWIFTPYALGWNVSDEQYELLPSTTLEQAQRLQTALLEPLRFNVAGLVTRFQGRAYLLLRRATPVYNYGNFGR